MTDFQAGSEQGDFALRRLTTSYFAWGSVALDAGAWNYQYYRYGVGIRIPDFTVQQGSTINTATLKFCCRYSTTGTPCNTRISAENVDDADQFINDAGVFDNRFANNTDTIDWDNIAAWTKDSWYTSISIVSVIQELVDRPTFASNAIILFFEDFDDRSWHAPGAGGSLSAFREGYGYGSDDRPVLSVTWTPPVGKVSSGSVVNLMRGMGLAVTPLNARLPVLKPRMVI